MTVHVARKSFLLICLFASLTVNGGHYLSAQSKPNASPREALLTAMTAMLAAKSYRMKEVQSGSGEGVGISTITKGDYVAPDKFHATVETDLGGGGKGEMILLEGVVYTKTPDGKWQKKPTDPQRIELEFARLRHAMLIDNLTRARNGDVKLVGQLELDGSTMFIYQYSFAGPPETVTRYPTKVWVGAGDGLPHKIEVGWGTAHKGLKFSFKTTTTYFDYNADVIIEAPMSAFR